MGVTYSHYLAIGWEAGPVLREYNRSILTVEGKCQVHMELEVDRLINTAISGYIRGPSPTLRKVRARNAPAPASKLAPHPPQFSFSTLAGPQSWLALTIDKK